jgi:hypothetical protein
MAPTATETSTIMNSSLSAHANGDVHSSEGWALRSLSPELMEYVAGHAACIVNVGHSAATQRVRTIYATESLSELFPHLREHLTAALPLLKGQFVID